MEVGSAATATLSAPVEGMEFFKKLVACCSEQPNLRPGVQSNTTSRREEEQRAADVRVLGELEPGVEARAEERLARRAGAAREAAVGGVGLPVGLVLLEVVSGFVHVETNGVKFVTRCSSKAVAGSAARQCCSA